MVSGAHLTHMQTTANQTAERLSAVRFAGDARIHIGLVTGDLARAVAFYTALFGEGPVRALSAPYNLGEREAFRRCFVDAGLGEPVLRTRVGGARFASLDDWLYTDIRGWTLAEMIDDAQFERLRQAARVELAHYQGPDGRIGFPAPAHLAIVSRP